MGLLKNLISNAVSEGVGKGVRDAVGKAVEGAVKPAADKLAGRAASSLDKTAQSVAQSTQAAADAAAQSAQAARQAGDTADAAPAGATAPGAGFASLEAAFGNWASTMQGFAGQAAQNLKECPNCGEFATADRTFCPKCGAKLPDKTVGARYVCPQCGKQNLPGETYCSGCGALLPEAAKQQEAQLGKWDTLLPQYPKWTQGGLVELEEQGTMNGYPVIRLNVDGAGQSALDAYVAALKAAGFTAAHGEDSDDFYKVVDGVCRCFDKTDALGGGGISAAFYVDALDKKAAAEQKVAAAANTAQDAAKAAANAAKGLFKKFF